ncbi:MAG: carbonic anhydrase [Propionivibrio sp.]|uniref:Carbonic anhydrase n=1 Tax=Candidatus Propionivibrio dominans TaxID=2954373 RepID=A0A9D7F5S0_9RHOO|nr:carbonic anhydrase [Candidatus Propionivibrio dominans]
MKEIARFIDGFRRFQEKYFSEDRELFEQLRQGQRPKAAIVACADSRVDPALLMDAEPGDVFVVRNVANLVPPYAPGGGYANVPAALEFAVLSLAVEHVIVLGHAQCGGIHALMNGTGPGGEFIGKWVGIAQRARERVLADLPAKTPALQARACEQAAILVSLENLMTYPWIAERVTTGAMHLHGWYFDIAEGELLSYQPARNGFERIGADVSAISRVSNVP